MNSNPNFSPLQSEVIGLSEQLRPLTVNYLGTEDNKHELLKIFFIAGQHGDERYGRIAASRIIGQLVTRFDKKFSSIKLAILSDANPDGSILETRKNANGIDINRDHQRLDSHEAEAIHSFVRSWNPHLIVDVHNYPPRRKHLLEKNLVYYHDIFIDIPTNPSVLTPLYNDGEDFVNIVKSHLESFHVSCERYTIVKPSGKVRHSTIDVRDARNCLSLRYGIPTILVEGRMPSRHDDEKVKEQLVTAQYLALCCIIKWAQSNRQHLIHNDSLLTQNSEIPIRAKYGKRINQFQMKFLNRHTKKTEEITLQQYAPKPEVTEYINLPLAYAIPNDKSKVIEILGKHGFVFNHTGLENCLYEYYQVHERVPSSINSKNRISLIKKERRDHLDNFTIYPINQRGGNCLAIFLEPRSRFGLHRYNDLDLSLSPGSNYPVLRIIGK